MQQQLLAACAVALLAAPADVTAGLSSRSRPPPSVLLVVVDDLGWRDVGFRGSAGYQTPHIDALTRDGTVLTGWYVCRVCVPTRTALMSGRYPWTNGIAAGMIVDGFPSSLPLVAPEPAGTQRPLRTLAERLHAVGYATTAAGKWDCGMERWSRTPTRRGLERFVRVTVLNPCRRTVPSRQSCSHTRSINPDGSTNVTENGYNVSVDNPAMLWLFDVRADPEERCVVGVVYLHSS